MWFVSIVLLRQYSKVPKRVNACKILQFITNAHNSLNNQNISKNDTDSIRTKINRDKFSVKLNTTTVCHVDNRLDFLM